MSSMRYSSHQKKILSCIIASFSFLLSDVIAQQKIYSVSNAHAHNDYIHPVPFYTAYNAGFGSIEADIILANNQLYVAHNAADTAAGKTLQNLYLAPLQKAIRKNKGHIYADRDKTLILLIDLKTPAEPTLEVLLKVLHRYKKVIACPGLKIVITGNQPDVSRLASFPAWLYFDGNLGTVYNDEMLHKVALFSDNFRKYSLWDGTGILVDSARKKVEAAVTKAHSLNKPIRFWAAPDIQNTWQQLIELNVDYINTDKIREISMFLNSFSPVSPQKKQ